MGDRDLALNIEVGWLMDISDTVAYHSSRIQCTRRSNMQALTVFTILLQHKPFAICAPLEW